MKQQKKKLKTKSYNMKKNEEERVLKTLNIVNLLFLIVIAFEVNWLLMAYIYYGTNMSISIYIGYFSFLIFTILVWVWLKIMFPPNEIIEYLNE